MTDRLKYQQRAIPPSLVRRTWKGTLRDEDNLPKDWEKGPTTGVLVSIEPIE